MAYAADTILIEGISVTTLAMLEIRCVFGEHGTLKLGGYVEAGIGEQFLYNTPENSEISVIAGEGNCIFSGIITSLKVSGKGNTSYVEAEGKTRSILLDQKKKSRSYQNVGMTYGELARTILADYPGAEILFSIPELPIGEIAVQYRETDWQFLKRMLSMLNAPLTCKPSARTIQLYAGVPEIPSGEWSYEGVGFRKELGEHNYWKQQGQEISDDSFLVKEIKTDHVPELFEQAAYQGQMLEIREIIYKLERGSLDCVCGLQKREGMLAKKEYPMHLIGVALEGNVAAVSGIQLKVHLKIDDEAGLGDVYWFPFSTLSASQDGSGWYYMPESGDQVRVYFPTKYTRDVIAVSAVSAYDGKGGGTPDRMGSPSTKYLSNPGGQEIKMAGDGVTLSCSGGAASVTIGSGGNIALYAANTLMVNATNNVSLESETEMSLLASQTAVVACAAGGKLQMMEGGILNVQGTEVKVD